MTEACTSDCWIEQYADEVYCDLETGHDGKHQSLQAGWEW